VHGGETDRDLVAKRSQSHTRARPRDIVMFHGVQSPCQEPNARMSAVGLSRSTACPIGPASSLSANARSQARRPPRYGLPPGAGATARKPRPARPWHHPARPVFSPGARRRMPAAQGPRSPATGRDTAGAAAPAATGAHWRGRPAPCFGPHEAAGQRVDADLDETEQFPVRRQRPQDRFAVRARGADVQADQHVAAQRPAQVIGDVGIGSRRPRLDPYPVGQHLRKAGPRREGSRAQPQPVGRGG
jgi:hypothetical protein